MLFLLSPFLMIELITMLFLLPPFLMIELIIDVVFAPSVSYDRAYN